MRWLEFITSALTALRVNKLRSSLTTLGIIIGVFAVIAIVSLIQGMNQFIAQQIQSLGSNIISVSKYPWVSLGDEDWREIRRRRPLTIEDAEAIARLPSVALVAPNIHNWEGEPMKYREETVQEVSIIGVTSTYQEVNLHFVESGRYIQESDNEHRRHVVVLAQDVVDALFPTTDPIGKRIRIGVQEFSVIGVLERKGNFLGRSLDNHVLIPLSTFQKMYGATGRIVGRFNSVTIDVQPKSQATQEVAIDQITELLRRRRNVPLDEADDFSVNTQSALTSVYRAITGTAFAVMIGVASISLMVGGIGIMNIMLVSVTERTREIGIRKAVGARRSEILWQFLIEAVTLSCFGGGLGIALGFTAAKVVATFTWLHAAISPWAVLLGFGFSAAVGIFFGIFPATKAARLDPIVALHYE
jgi:putative ABC transport system permease protein